MNLTMNLTIDPSAKQPPFDQLKQQLIQQIMERQLPAGMKLPSVRHLAADLGLAPNTVARTYRELESEGYVITRGRSGTTVAPIAPVSEDARLHAAAFTADYVAAMRGLGLGDDSIVGLVSQAL